MQSFDAGKPVRRTGPTPCQPQAANVAFPRPKRASTKTCNLCRSLGCGARVGAARAAPVRSGALAAGRGRGAPWRTQARTHGASAIACWLACADSEDGVVRESARKHHRSKMHKPVGFQRIWPCRPLPPPQTQKAFHRQVGQQLAELATHVRFSSQRGRVAGGTAQARKCASSSF